MLKLFAISLVLFSLAVADASAALLSGSIGSHDPSRMILCNGKYYVYSTGGGMKYSSDGISWTAGPSPFSPATAVSGTTPARGVLPASLKSVVPGDRGIWAPDVIFYHNRYLLYYSACAPLTVSRCGIGLLTSPTLDPASSAYRWTDAGVVIVTDNKVEKKSAIDPGPFIDAKGDLWLSWGSGYANGATESDPTIFVSKLDNATGLRSKADLTFYPVAPGHIEASYIHYRLGYYYVFWNDGGCCSGVASTYQIHVARSASPQGPYVNKTGKEGEGEVFMSTIAQDQVYGPGHMGIESEPGLDRFSFHYYNAEGRPVLGVRTLVWDADGWPSVGKDLSPGIYKITAGDSRALGEHGKGSADDAQVELQPYIGSQFQNWTVDLTQKGYYRLTSAGSHKSLEIAVPSADIKENSAVITGTGSDMDDRQQWIIELTSDGKSYRLRSCATHEVLALRVNHKNDRKVAALTTDEWQNLQAQRWIFSAP